MSINGGALWAILWGCITGLIETMLRAGRPLVRVQGGHLSSLLNIQPESVTIHCPAPWVSERFVPELNRLKGEADQSTPISCGVKND